MPKNTPRDKPVAYKGYYITPVGLAETTHWVVIRDGHTICRPTNLLEAKRQIDELLE